MNYTIIDKHFRDNFDVDDVWQKPNSAAAALLLG